MRCIICNDGLNRWEIDYIKAKGTEALCTCCRTDRAIAILAKSKGEDGDSE